MAILTSTELAEIRQDAAKGQVVTWSKADLDTASQVAEDHFDTNLAAAIGAMSSSIPVDVRQQILRTRLQQRFRGAI